MIKMFFSANSFKSLRNLFIIPAIVILAFTVNCEILDLVLEDSPEETSTERTESAESTDGRPLDITRATYKLTVQHSKKVLDIYKSSTEAGMPCVQSTWTGASSQKWSIESLGSGIHKITSLHSGLVLEVKDASKIKETVVVQGPWRDLDSQKWKIEKHSDGFCKLVAVHSGQVLDIKGESIDDGAECIQWPWKTQYNQNQRWKMEEIQ